MPSLLYVFNKKKSNAQCSATESCVLLELERAAVICFTFGRWHSQLDGLENCFQKVRKISSGGLLNIQHSPLQQIAEYLAIHDTMTSVQPGGWWQVMSYSDNSSLWDLRWACRAATTKFTYLGLFWKLINWARMFHWHKINMLSHNTAVFVFLFFKEVLFIACCNHFQIVWS